MFHPPTLLCKKSSDTGMFIISCMCGTRYLLIYPFLVKCLPKKSLLQGSSFFYFINFNRENRSKIELINVIRSSSLNKSDFVMAINEQLRYRNRQLNINAEWIYWASTREQFSLK